MKKANYFLMTSALLFAIIMLSGCTITSGKKNAEIKITDVYQGSTGVDFDFLKDSPPNEVYQNQSFQIITSIKNKGPYPVTNAKLVLSYDNSEFSGAKDYFFTLEGKDAYNTRDDEKVKSFYMQSKTLLPNSALLQSTILATVCYGYQNKLSATVCIDLDPYELQPIEKACKMQDQSFSGQGGPVGVSRIEQKAVVSENEVRPQFIIYIKNFGQGEVISEDKIQDFCGAQSVSRDNFNQVRLKDISFSQYTFSDIECEPESLRLYENEESFICTLSEEIPKTVSTFKTNLNVEFGYGYTLTKSKSIAIKKTTIK